MLRKWKYLLNTTKRTTCDTCVQGDLAMSLNNTSSQLNVFFIWTKESLQQPYTHSYYESSKIFGTRLILLFSIENKTN